jgi:ribosomal protein S18 acetylase RimI-like enzyme
MLPTPLVRLFSAEEWPLYRSLRLRALAQAPEAFGGTLANEQDRPDAEWARRLAVGLSSGWDFPAVVEVAGEPVGLAWGHFDPAEPKVARLYQVWVAPTHRRLGAGQALLEAVIAWARARQADYLDLDVTVGDTPAARLYARAGFQPNGPLAPLRAGSSLLEQPQRLNLQRDVKAGDA